MAILILLGRISPLTQLTRNRHPPSPPPGLTATLGKNRPRERSDRGQWSKPPPPSLGKQAVGYQWAGTRPVSALWPSYTSECRGRGRGPTHTWHSKQREIPRTSYLANILKVPTNTNVTWLVNLLNKHQTSKEIDCFLETGRGLEN